MPCNDPVQTNHADTLHLGDDGDRLSHSILNATIPLGVRWAVEVARIPPQGRTCYLFISLAIAV